MAFGQQTSPSGASNNLRWACCVLSCTCTVATKSLDSAEDYYYYGSLALRSADSRLWNFTLVMLESSQHVLLLVGLRWSTVSGLVHSAAVLQFLSLNLHNIWKDSETHGIKWNSMAQIARLQKKLISNLYLFLFSASLAREEGRETLNSSSLQNHFEQIQCGYSTVIHHPFLMVYTTHKNGD